LLLLDLAHGQTYDYEECATVTGSCVATVSNTVKTFCTDGLEKLLVLERNVNSDNARRKVDGRAEAKIIEIACGPVPDGHSRWTLRLLEDRAKVELDTPVSREAIRRALKKTDFDLTSQNTGVSRTKKIQNS
jgi:transposase